MYHCTIGLRISSNDTSWAGRLEKQTGTAPRPNYWPCTVNTLLQHLHASSVQGMDAAGEAEWLNRRNSHWSAAITRCTPCTPTTPAEPYPIARYTTAAEARPQSLCAVGYTNIEIQLQFFLSSLKCRPLKVPPGAHAPLAPSSRRHWETCVAFLYWLAYHPKRPKAQKCSIRHCAEFIFTQILLLQVFTGVFKNMNLFLTFFLVIVSFFPAVLLLLSSRR